MARHDIIEKIDLSANSATIKMVGELIDYYLNEARAANDTASGSEVLINQGKIQLCRLIKADLKVDL